MKSKYFIFFLFLSFVLSQESNKEIDGIAAIVENNVILKSDLLQMVNMTAAQSKIDFEKNPNLYKDLQVKVLKSMINQKVVLEMAILDSIVIDDNEVDQALEQQVENLISQTGGKDGAERALGQSIKDFRREFWYEMHDRLITERYQQGLLNNLVITREDVENFLHTYKDSLPITPTKFKIRHLLRKIKPSEEATQSTRSFLLEMKEDIKLKRESFDELAMRFSEDPGSKNNGGLLGWVKRGSLVKAFETVAFTLEINKLSDPIETQFGFHLIETLEKKGDMIKVRHILINPPKTPKDTEKAFSFIKSLGEDSIKTIQDFEMFVDKYSEDDLSKKVGGNLGWIDPINYGVVEIGQSIKYLDKDVCSPPINSSLGIHLLWIEDVKEGGVLNLENNYSDVENLALNYKKMTWYNEWIEKAQSKFYVEIKAY